MQYLEDSKPSVMTKAVITTTRYRSPLGELILGSIGNSLCLCDWMEEKRRAKINRRICHHLNATIEEGSSDIIEMAVTQLDEYFKGLRRDFTVPLLFAGTEFQRSVWSQLLTIPYGQTISYLEQASRINKPEAVRAVAAATASNAISIFVPCHRVIGSNNKLTGYAGGLTAKQALLALETKA